MNKAKNTLSNYGQDNSISMNREDMKSKIDNQDSLIPNENFNPNKEEINSVIAEFEDIEQKLNYLEEDKYINDESEYFENMDKEDNNRKTDLNRRIPIKKT